MHLGTAELLARVRVLNEAGEIAAGGRDLVQISLEGPTTARIGDRFIIRTYSPQATIAGGTVLEPLAGKLRRSEFPAARETLSNLSDADQGQIATAYITAAGETGLTKTDLLARTGWLGNVLDAILARNVEAGSVVRAGDRVITAETFGRLKERLVAALRTHHKKDPLSKGMTREALRGPRVPTEVFDAILTALMSENKIEINGDTLALAEKKAALSPEDDAIRSRIEKNLADSGLQVPKTEELLGEAIAGTESSTAHAKKILFLLLDSGEAVKVSEEFVFSRAAIDGLIAKLREHADRGDRTIDVPKFKGIAGVSRKYAIPLLEYFDREKLTLRTGDRRVIR